MDTEDTNTVSNFSLVLRHDDSDAHQDSLADIESHVALPILQSIDETQENIDQSMTPVKKDAIGYDIENNLFGKYQ